MFFLASLVASKTIFQSPLMSFLPYFSMTPILKKYKTLNIFYPNVCYVPYVFFGVLQHHIQHLQTSTSWCPLLLEKKKNHVPLQHHCYCSLSFCCSLLVFMFFIILDISSSLVLFGCVLIVDQAQFIPKPKYYIDLNFD
jgi:hypothetical protein